MSALLRRRPASSLLLGSLLAAMTATIAQAQVAFEYEGSLAAVRHVVVPPVVRTQTTQLVDGGVFDCDGYKSVVLNLAGEVKDPVIHAGKIGAILVPEVDPFVRAFEQLNLLPVTIEIDVNVKPGTAYYMAEPKRADIGFPRYHVYFYNETGGAVSASFFAYRGR